MNKENPIVVALPLDEEAENILSEARELALRLGRSVTLVHALSRRALESEDGEASRIADAEKLLLPHVKTLRDAGLEVTTNVAVEKPADLVLETAYREHAELVMVGGGRPSTVRRWLVGSVAEAVVRRASAWVWVVRGASPIGAAVLCAVDMSPQSKQALIAGIRMARALVSPLRVLSVLPDDVSVSADDTTGTIEAARASIGKLLEEVEVEGLTVDLQIVRGEPAECIVEAAKDAGLVVVGSRGFDPMAPEHLGPITSRTLRYSQCSALMIREVDDDLKRRETAIEKLADDYENAWKLMDDDREDEALPLLERAAQRAPANDKIQDAFAVVLDRVGRTVEARGRREIAAMIRKRIG